MLDKTPSLPLAGIVVVDFTANAAGPSCSMLLGDFGAEVIKIEPPGGDSTRVWGTARCGKNNDQTPTFISMNRNKSSVVLDLKAPDGLKTAHALMKTADVFIESFSPGVAERLGIGYAKAAELKPDIIYCSVSGFGQTGPLASRPGFDMLMQAFAGHMSITGEPGGRSVRGGPSSTDLVTGAHAALGIMMALRHRDQTGNGQRVDTSLFDNAVYLVCNHITDAVNSGKLPAKFGSDFPLMAPFGVFNASDREFYMGISSDDMWRRWCAEIKRPELGTDPRFTKNFDRLQNRVQLHATIFPIFLERTAQEWVDIAIRLGIPTALVQNLIEVANHEQTVARELMIDSGVDHIKTVGTPLKLSRTPGALHRPPPDLGADTARILGALAHQPAAAPKPPADTAGQAEVLIKRTGRSDSVAVITLNRPDRANSVTPAFAQLLLDTVEGAIADATVKAIVLTGAGKQFCAGADAADAIELAKKIARGEHPSEPFGGILRLIHQLTLTLHSAPKPIIAAINGPAAAGGLDLALACDYRIAVSAARFVESYVKLGLPPLNGGAWLLSNLVGRSQAMRILLSGETIDADRALTIGLIDEIAPPDALLDQAIRLAEAMSTGPADVIAFTKREVSQGDRVTLQDALARAYAGGVTFTQTATYREAVERMLSRAATPPVR